MARLKRKRMMKSKRSKLEESFPSYLQVGVIEVVNQPVKICSLLSEKI